MVMEYKICTKCLCRKPIEEFRLRVSGKYRQSWCIDCQKVGCQEYQRKNGDRYRKTRYKKLKVRLQELGKFLIEAKSKPCADCGNIFHPVAMDFDHVRGEKTTEVSTLVRSGYSLERIAEEVAKCEVVCACCHRVRTFERRAKKSGKGMTMYPSLTKALLDGGA